MAHVICRHNDKYNIYTTIADGFLFESSITLDELKEFTEDQYGSMELCNYLTG